MAKKTHKKQTGPKKGSTKKAAAKKAAAKKSAASKGKKARVAVMDASAAKQLKLFRAIRKLAKEHGILNELTAVQFEPTAPVAKAKPSAESHELGPAPAGLESAPSAVGPGPCPHGQITRIVCRRQADGTVVCKSECQPI
jgi:hypothetical protein